MVPCSVVRLVINAHSSSMPEPKAARGHSHHHQITDHTGILLLPDIRKPYSVPSGKKDAQGKRDKTRTCSYANQ